MLHFVSVFGAHVWGPRGAGVFVETPPTDYPIGRRVRFHKAIEATGRLPSKRVLAVTRRACDSAEASALQLSPGDPVFDYQGLSLSAGAPIAVFTSVFPAARVPDLPDALQKTSSVTQALRACGIADYIRAQTRLSAVRLDATQALHLRLREGDPALKSIGINICPEGRPIEYGLTWFAGERVTLTVTPD